MTSDGREGGRPRQARVFLNDAKILEAAIRVISEGGWSALSPSRVSAESGLSRKAVQVRFQDGGELGVAVWSETAGPALSDLLRTTLAVAGLLDESASAPDLAASFTQLSGAEPALRTAAELIVIAHFVPSLRKAVTATLGAQVVEWCGPSGDGAAAARRAFLLDAALGLLLTSRRPGAADIDWNNIAGQLIEGFRSSASPRELPAEGAPHLGGPLDFGTRDSGLESILNAVLALVGEHGFDGTTTLMIARASGQSEGLIFSRYTSKLELFLDATRRQHSLTYAANDAFSARIKAQSGAGVAEAVTLREFMRPRLARDRALALEQWRLGWHNAELSTANEQALAEFFADMGRTDPKRLGAKPATWSHYAHAHGLGLALLPLLAPECWTLPYDVVTIPLTERGLFTV